MARAPKHLEARLLADLRPLLEGWAEPVAFGTGWDGAIYAAARRSDENLRVDKGHGSFAKTRLATPTDYLIVRWWQGQTRTLVHERESLVVSYVQPFPGGVLLVGARCQWRPEGAEQNAVALDWNGRELQRMTLGDGIQDVRTTREGTTWVSYFDEGIFGNFGWGPSGQPPIGAPGLVAFTPTGEIDRAYDPEAAGTDDICDAYAMNVSADGDVWVYFYTEFPLVHLQGGTYRKWKLRVSGARALAVRGDQALLLGDYDSGLARIIELRATGDSKQLSKLPIQGPDGAPLEPAVVMGAGDRLVFFKDRQAFVVESW